jgi:hypothetical protein
MHQLGGRLTDRSLRRRSCLQIILASQAAGLVVAQIVSAASHAVYPSRPRCPALVGLFAAGAARDQALITGGATRVEVAEG